MVEEYARINSIDMLDLVDQLQSLLTDSGVLAFTFIDPFHHSWPGNYDGDNFSWRLLREIELAAERNETLEIDIPRLVKRVQGARNCVLINGTDLYLEHEGIPPYDSDNIYGWAKLMRGQELSLRR